VEVGSQVICPESEESDRGADGCLAAAVVVAAAASSATKTANKVLWNPAMKQERSLRAAGSPVGTASQRQDDRS
jgi:hypothetical protein